MNHMYHPLVLYGAGGHAGNAKEYLESNGHSPVCFVDADVEKQGGECLGLPVLSLKQAKLDYVDFYVYITPGWDMDGIRCEIYGFLLEKGIPKERILNFSETEVSLGCWFLDYQVLAMDQGLTFCCELNDAMNTMPMATWMENNWNIESAVTQWIGMRDSLRRSLKEGHICKCTGCVGVKSERRPVSKKVKFLSIGFELPCQLSCVYCRYANVKNRFHNKNELEVRFAKDFNYERFIKILERYELLSYDTIVAFAAGELTVNPKFEEILNAIQRYSLHVYSNGVVFNERLAKLTARLGSRQIISIDAGTNQTYKSVHGLDAFERVWANIKKYAACGVEVEAKYVFITENSNDTDVEGFVYQAVQAGVKLIQIAADSYRQESFSDEQLRLMAKMLNLAENNGLPCYNAGIIKPDEETAIRHLRGLG